MTKKINTLNIIFWGPLGHNLKIGGGESGNQRTIEQLKKRGYQIRAVPKPYPPTNGILKSVRYALRLLNSILSFTIQCKRASKNDRLAHVSAFYQHLVYFEMLMLIFAKIMRIPFVYEIRGGAMILAFRKGSLLYKFVFTLILKYSNAILVQGQEHKNFVKKRTHAKVIYYPNYVNNEVLYTNKYISKCQFQKINLVYFGRFTLDKGIETIIHTCEKLIYSKHLCTHLHLIGEGTPQINARIRKLIDKLNLNSHVTLYPPLSQKELNKILNEMHFFVFPTYNPMEGHSNSFPEAMALGVVPICSRHGFNQSVVAQSGVILEPTSSSKEYANAINEIWCLELWPVFSKKCKKRISQLFTADVVIDRINEQYLKMIQ